MKEQRIERLPEILFEIGKAIGSELDLDRLFARISELVCALIGADACSILLLDPSGCGLVARAAHGLQPAQLAQVVFRVGEGVAGWVAARGETALIDDVSGDGRFIELPGVRESIASLLCVPLNVRGGTCVGVLSASAASPGAFGQRDLELLAFLAKTIALDIENIRLRRLAITDPLTSAYNREFLHSQLPFEIEQSVMREQPLCIALIDIDHFKAINDAFGHGGGDQVLIDVVARLRGAIRTSDFLIRYGGEEFLTVLPNTPRERAWEVGERMRVTMRRTPLRVNDTPVAVCISIGIAQHRITHNIAEDADALIRRADRALYAAKRRGRDRVEVAP
jgi:diguanylate cyclase (GGDEF)-like protein